MLVIIYTLELSTVLYLKYIFNFDLLTISSNIVNSTVVTLPEFIILIFAVYIGYVHTNTGGITIIRIWKTSKKFRIITFIQIILTFSTALIIYNFIVKAGVLHNLSADLVLKISITLYTLLLLHIIIPLGVSLKYLNKLK